MRLPPRFYAAFAVILPVSLGLGLVYLTIVGRIDAGSAVMTALGLAAVLGVAIFLRDLDSDQRANRGQETRR